MIKYSPLQLTLNKRGLKDENARTGFPESVPIIEIFFDFSSEDLDDSMMIMIGVCNGTPLLNSTLGGIPTMYL